MTDAAAEVARIKAAFAARDGAWMDAVKVAITTHGPRTTAELADACGLERDMRGTFSTFMSNQKARGRLVVAGVRTGPTGFVCNEWGLP